MCEGGGGGRERERTNKKALCKKKKQSALEHTLQNNLLSQLMTKCNQPNSKDTLSTQPKSVSLWDLKHELT